VSFEADASALTAAQLETALADYRGEIEQLPPMYSAIKRDGQPLYKLARAGIDVERSPRRIVVSELELPGLSRRAPSRGGPAHRLQQGHLRAFAGDGYRRAARGGWPCRGCDAPASGLLRRGLRDAGYPEALREREEPALLDALLKPMDVALTHFPLLQTARIQRFYLRQGQPVLVPNAPCDGMVRVALETGEFLGLGEILDDGRVAPRRLVVSGR
jgi:tRNA pseudouridine55 synthase